MLYKTINLSAIERNYCRALEKSNKLVFPVVKSNAYGCGLKEVVKTLTAKFDIPLFCVSSLDEASAFLRLKTGCDVLVFETPRKRLVDHPNIVYSLNDIKEIKAISHLKNRRVHIQYDLGHHRSSIFTKEKLDEAFLMCQQNDIRVDGLYGHLRIQSDKKAINAIEALFPRYEVKYKHLCSSETYMLNIGNAIRIGSNLYGDGLDPKFEQAIELYTYASRIIRAHKGDTFGYYPGFTATESCLLAELPIGYAVGFLRNYSGSMLYCNNHLYPVVGAISMNSLLVKVDHYVPKKAKFYLTSKDYPLTYFAQNNSLYNPEMLLLFHPEHIIYKND
jgi:alanine racemase